MPPFLRPLGPTMSPKALYSRLSSTRSLPRRLFATVSSSPSQNELLKRYVPGMKIDEFEVTENRYISEFDLTAIRLQHTPTKADILHVSKPDPNNVFSIGFQTAPNDSTGLPHILEHTALCGSQQYPVRDPFFKMLNRSLANYMNALTGSDFTMYPFATENDKDYFGLMGVYLDATLNPLLRELDFMQEGWRLEHEIPSDKSSPITFKGVVYNEMKGAMSDPYNLFRTRFQQHFYPGTPYMHNSGGEPSDITSLTYEDLVAFHRKNYHPSNSKVFFYGDIELERKLEFLKKRFEGFGMALKEEMKELEAWKEPKRVVTHCAPDPMSPPEKQNKVCLAFLTNNSRDIFESFTLRILSYLLLEGAASPLYKALIESGLGSEYSAGTGYDTTSAQTNVSIGLQGVHNNDIQKVEETIIETLKQTMEMGFDSQRIEGVIHQIELGAKHKTAKFGLNLGMSIIESWIHGVNPIDAIEFNKYIVELRKQLEVDPKFLESRIQKYFLDNKHRLTFIMTPEESYSEALEKEESDRLAKKLSTLDESAKLKIHENGIKLAKIQETKEDLSCLPTLSVQDLSKSARTFPLVHTPISEIPTQWRTTQTNSITYLNLLFPTATLPQDLKPYLPLFCSALTGMGTLKKELEVLDEDIRLKTGGISVGTHLSTWHSDLGQVEEGIMVSSSCLPKNTPFMYDLIREIMQETNWMNLEKLKTVIMSNASYLTNSIVDSGHRFAMLKAASQLTLGKQLGELYGGVTQISFMNQLANSLAASTTSETTTETIPSTSLETIANKLKQISEWIQQHGVLRTSLVVNSEKDKDVNERVLRGFLDVMNARVADATDSVIAANHHHGFTPSPQNMFIPLPFPVSFSSLSMATEPYTSNDSASLTVLARLLTTSYLHREIREKNGAYGGGATYSALDGIWGFYSYRDPKSLETIDTYRKAITEIACKGVFETRELEEAKLAIFQGLDAPVSAASEGGAMFVNRLSDDIVQTRRDQLFAVTKDDLVRVAQTMLLPQLSTNQASVALLGGDGKDLDMMKQNGWKVVDM